MLKKLYDWVISWAHTPYGAAALFLLALSESIFFPIPPDVLLIALCVALPKRAFYYALISTVASVIGGVIGYVIGFYFMEGVGYKILEFYGIMERYISLQGLYQRYDAWAVGIGGFTPIPYKAFTISAGAFKIDFFIFVVVSFISRGLRFFIVGTLLYLYGDTVRNFIEKYFNLLTLLFMILLIVGFIVLSGVLGYL